MGSRAFQIRAFDAATDGPAALKLWAAVSGYDGGAPTRTPAQLKALLGSEPHAGGEAWRVAVAGNGAVVGLMEVGFIGTKRTSVHVAVNPAWRRAGVATGLLHRLPEGRRLLVQSRASIEGATALLQREGFSERKRHLRMRRSAHHAEVSGLPKWASFDEDTALDPSRLRRALLLIFGEDAESDLAVLDALLRRPGTRALYLVTPNGDEGLALVGASARCLKGELDRNGVPTVGRLLHVGLSKACRGKGLSRKLIRAGLNALAEEGYRTFEVSAEKKRTSAIELYEGEGFETVDEDIDWIRRDDAR